MAIEMHVLFRGDLPSRDEVNRAMQELEFPFSIDETVTLNEQIGFMPMHFRETQTGVEFDSYKGRDLIEGLRDNFDDDFEVDPPSTGSRVFAGPAISPRASPA